MQKLKNLLAMKKNLSKYFIFIFIAGCGVKGVEEGRKDFAPTPREDGRTNSNDVPVIRDSIVEVNFDSVFKFTEEKPIDSLILKSGVKLVYLKHGTKTPVKKYDVAAINYRGTLTNGKMIESNEQFKKAIPFVVGLGMTFDAFDEDLQKI